MIGSEPDVVVAGVEAGQLLGRRGAGDGEFPEALEVALARSTRCEVQEHRRRARLVPERVDAAGGDVHETSLTQPSLETLFIKLTGRALRE